MPRPTPRPMLDPATLRDEPADLIARTQDLTPEQKFIAAVKGMLVGDEYRYAEQLLRGILGTVTRTGTVSDRQRQAVGRIADNPHRPSETGRNRRRGGW